jgi:glutathione S-transferase
MIELYFSPGACSFVPHVGLQAVQAAGGPAFEPKLIKLHRAEHKTEQFLALNPEGQVPLLVVDGKPLNQIVAMCDWIDRSFPQAGLLPAESWARAQALSTLAWMNNTAHPTFTHVFMPDKFADSEATRAEVRSVAVGKYRSLLERIAVMSQAASPYWLGSGLSFLDAYALTLLRWGGLAGIDPDSMPGFKAYVDCVAAHPVVAAVIERERLQLNVFKKPAA